MGKKGVDRARGLWHESAALPARKRLRFLWSVARLRWATWVLVRRIEWDVWRGRLMPPEAGARVAELLRGTTGE